MISRLLLLSFLLIIAGCNYRNHPPDERAADESIDSASNSGSHAADSSSKESAVANIRVSSPKRNARIDSASFTLSGTARTFENGLSYRLVDSSGSRLTEGHMMSKGEMGDFNPYSTTVRIGSSYSGTATLEVFQYSAKDGEPIDMVRLPLQLRSASKDGRKFLQIFLTNARLNGSQDCEKVYALGREYEQTAGVADQAMRELLRGPTEEERKGGYGTEIPNGTRLLSIRISNGIASVNFSAELNRGGGACHVAAVRAQIESTLRQFPSVKRVVIASDGNSMEALQP
jgi:hypothetical protein